MAKINPTQTKIVVPASVSMVSLLGPRDEFLRVVEKEFTAEINVRGNEITVIAEPEERILVEQLFDELVAVVRSGHGLTSDAVERSV
ncbi:MAG TPA: PhoH family protein, partial [Actinopolymorphaceae bacterium]|nr:PhoH family protein [Actinopolymorphaceae bacterium]